MNATVARIVELLFEELEMTEEVQAIKDEVMNNCQERFVDLMEAGMSEDEAIGAVVESLKGMEDVLKDYPRKHSFVDDDDDDEDDDDEDEDEDDDDEEDVKNIVCNAEEVQRIKVQLRYEDVYIEESDDELVRVECAADAPISLSIADGLLSVEHVDRERKRDESYNVRFVRNQKTFAFEGENFKMNSFGDLFNALKNIKFTTSDTSMSELYIYLPKSCVPMLTVTTASGDVEIEDVALKELMVTTTSGDVNVDDVQTKRMAVITTSGDVEVELGEEDELCHRVEIKTTSGDVSATVYTETAEVQSISGDMELEGTMRQVKLSSISGEINLRADVEEVDFKSISGDVGLICDGDELRSINGKTTSGEIDVRLPRSVNAAVNANSRSGDVRTNRSSTGYQSATVNLQSISGEISVR